MPSFVQTTHMTIAWGDCDPAGIVFNPKFFVFFDNCTWNLFNSALDVKPHELAGRYGIVGIPLVDARANFMKPAAFGDEVVIESRISRFGRTSFDVEHRLSNGGALAVEGFETRVWAGPDPADPDGMKGMPIPAEVMAKFG